MRILDIAHYGEPHLGQRILIVTRQQKDCWESFDYQTTEIVPEKPGHQQALATQALPVPSCMHKGCTSDQCHSHHMR